jgi:regulatory protein
VSDSALDKALELVARRPHFRAELARKLTQRGFAGDEIEAALARLSELGYLDDAELAAREAERLRERRGLARAGVAAELARKGAAAEAVDAALAGEDAEKELAAALAFAARWRQVHAADAAALARALSRKGYPGHVIFSVLKDLVPDAPAGDGVD